MPDHTGVGFFYWPEAAGLAAASTTRYGERRAGRLAAAQARYAKVAHLEMTQ
ncbi:hypothetical protein [Paraburkholderia sp. J41]|uniref:hypothetical protein n=1 Tax=Paraburkholderia sp. J41 TaxID=2805433 RepID=UPI002AC334F2|nr:hypothetical protein [Paraburkholderia sp. J41]